MNNKYPLKCKKTLKTRFKEQQKLKKEKCVPEIPRIEIKINKELREWYIMNGRDFD